MNINILSTGFASQQLQLPIALILETSNRLGIVPGSINGVPYFTEADCERIRSAAADMRHPTTTGFKPVS